jgi:hypothetical protein
MRRIALLFIFAASCLAQQSRLNFTGAITGALAGDDGTALIGAHVTLHLLPPYPPGRLRQTDWAAVSGAEGSFRFVGLSEGRYQLCAQVLQSTWLNPCEWGLRPPTVSLSSAQPTAGVTMVLAKGAAVPIRIEDPGQLLSQNEGKTPGAHLLLGVPNDALVFCPASVVSRDATGRNHQIVVPFDSTVKLVVYSSFFRLSDAVGIPLPRTAVHIPVLVPRGRPPTPVALKVTGGR